MRPDPYKQRASRRHQAGRLSSKPGRNYSRLGSNLWRYADENNQEGDSNNVAIGTPSIEKEVDDESKRLLEKINFLSASSASNALDNSHRYAGNAGDLIQLQELENSLRKLPLFSIHLQNQYIDPEFPVFETRNQTISHSNDSNDLLIFLSKSNHHNISSDIAHNETQVISLDDKTQEMSDIIDNVEETENVIDEDEEEDLEAWLDEVI